VDQDFKKQDHATLTHLFNSIINSLHFSWEGRCFSGMHIEKKDTDHVLYDSFEQDGLFFRVRVLHGI